jgi:hypothetical protein
MSLLSVLSPESREELRDLVQEVVREELRTRERNDARREWLSTTDVAALVSTSENAVRCPAPRGSPRRTRSAVRRSGSRATCTAPT